MPEAKLSKSIMFDSEVAHKAPRQLAEERPIAFEYNGLAYAVMLASPRDLEDFAVGFTLSEGLIKSGAEIAAVDIAHVDRGTIMRLVLPEQCIDPLRDRLRLRLVEGSCGLCGLESIEEVLRPLPTISISPKIDAQAVSVALHGLRQHQPFGRATGAMHAAAFCAPDGSVLAAREDIGRHNALDKLSGHLAREGYDPKRGFALLSARCSCELVEKTVRAGVPALVTISAASDLAVARAREANLTLVALARSDSAQVMNDPFGVFE